ncbi:MAG TPA: DUF692 domain-containing protein [Dongiaceae bacterium]|nr:DUF692 domain-containing protein [Dongiaceae bacterium]
MPARAGIGLRAPHLASVVAAPPAVGFLEVHAENYMGGGPGLRALERLGGERALSLHGVGLSLGGTEGPEPEHLERLAGLAGRLEPALVSEHLSWSAAEGVYLNDLLPLPYTEEALEVVARHVERVQERLGRPILLENPSSYLAYCHSTIPEPAFLAALAERTGCGILCDLNNIVVSARNLGFAPLAYLDGLPGAAIGEYHLAGHSAQAVAGREILIDDHGSAVSAEVWALYGAALRRFGWRPTLIEWDSRLPALPVLLAEAGTADALAAEALGEGYDVRAA